MRRWRWPCVNIVYGECNLFINAPAVAVIVVVVLMLVLVSYHAPVITRDVITHVLAFEV